LLLIDHEAKSRLEGLPNRVSYTEFWFLRKIPYYEEAGLEELAPASGLNTQNSALGEFRYLRNFPDRTDG